ncbi:MAG: DHH family phosphoesterase [Clostridium sp.]
MNNKYKDLMINNKMYLVIISLLIIIVFYYNHIGIGIVAAVIFLISIFLNIKGYINKKAEFQEFIENFSTDMNMATNNNLMNSPFPLMIIGINGEILWYNQKSNVLPIEGSLLGKNIKEISKELNIKQIYEGKKDVFKYIKVGDNYYDIFSTSIDKTKKTIVDNSIALLTFCDVTDKFNLEENVKNDTYTIMLIEVDNLSEVLKTASENEAPLLGAAIERTLNNYSQSLYGMIKKYESNKYIVVAQNKFIKKEVENKFEILDQIRDLYFGNKLAVTLSVGIGVGGVTANENYSYAESAKDLALGRGGDQVVLKNKEKLSFFGGKTKEVEKRTKVRARIIAHALVDLVNQSDRVFIMGHKNADIDCMGSAIGLGSVIRNLGKKYNIILEETGEDTNKVITEVKSEYENEKIFINAEQSFIEINENSLLIIVDVHNKAHVENMEVVNKASKVVIIDHHRKSPDFITNSILSYIETYASSTAELVTEMLPYMVEKPNIKIIEAVALLSGICVDTKNFTFKTGVRTFEAAAFLRRLGADTVAVKKMFSQNLDVYIKKADIIKNVEVINDIAIAICPNDTDNNIIAAQVADELIVISPIKASFALISIKDNIFISARSLDDINVQVILESLHGGGHMNMAGAKLINTTMEKAVELLKESIDKYLREAEKQ